MVSWVIKIAFSVVATNVVCVSASSLQERAGAAKLQEAKREIISEAAYEENESAQEGFVCDVAEEDEEQEEEPGVANRPSIPSLRSKTHSASTEPTNVSSTAVQHADAPEVAACAEEEVEATAGVRTWAQAAEQDAASSNSLSLQQQEHETAAPPTAEETIEPTTTTVEEDITRSDAVPARYSEEQDGDFNTVIERQVSHPIADMQNFIKQFYSKWTRNIAGQTTPTYLQDDYGSECVAERKNNIDKTACFTAISKKANERWNKINFGWVRKNENKFNPLDQKYLYDAIFSGLSTKLEEIEILEQETGSLSDRNTELKANLSITLTADTNDCGCIGNCCTNSDDNSFGSTSAPPKLTLEEEETTAEFKRYTQLAGNFEGNFDFIAENCAEPETAETCLAKLTKTAEYDFYHKGENLTSFSGEELIFDKLAFYNALNRDSETQITALHDFTVDLMNMGGESVAEMEGSSKMFENVFELVENEVSSSKNCFGQLLPRENEDNSNNGTNSCCCSCCCVPMNNCQIATAIAVPIGVVGGVLTLTGILFGACEGRQAGWKGKDTNVAESENSEKFALDGGAENDNVASAEENINAENNTSTDDSTDLPICASPPVFVSALVIALVMLVLGFSMRRSGVKALDGVNEYSEGSSIGEEILYTDGDSDLESGEYGDSEKEEFTLTPQE